MAYNYASAFTGKKTLHPSSAEYQLAQEIAVTAMSSFYSDFGTDAVLFSIEIEAETQTVSMKGKLGEVPLAALYSFNELGFSM